MQFRIVIRRILKLRNCEMVGRVRLSSPNWLSWYHFTVARIGSCSVVSFHSFASSLSCTITTGVAFYNPAAISFPGKNKKKAQPCLLPPPFFTLTTSLAVLFFFFRLPIATQSYLFRLYLASQATAVTARPALSLILETHNSQFGTA